MTAGLTLTVPVAIQLAQPGELETGPAEAEAGYGGGVGTETPRLGVCHGPDAVPALRTNTTACDGY